ncbi:structural maintenance of chromosomes protein 3-like isoform X3 [Zootermopsis nevadensis]|nr:structural maintenance of chromosomes protein 3-like isoform X3 [Zootermopsis nevadensis]
MYIKQVIIEGFKSYREKTVLEPFHPDLNVIVGGNGSGKSNILYAIQFVLSDEFSHLKKDVRHNILFYGFGHRVVVASVEIVFDNTDKQLPIPSDDVSFCRRIGLNYDQFYINSKVVPYKEMVNVLVSAGFCSCNTYHIVKQGKVNQLATAPDAYRLSVLLEVAGIQVHEDEIQKMKTVLEEIKQKLQESETLMQALSKRLEVLVVEKEDLEAFTGLDRTRRALEYCLYESQLKAMMEELETMEEFNLPGLKNQIECRSLQQKAQEKMFKTKKLLEDNEKHLEALQDCQSKLRIEEQQVQGHIDEMIMKINTLTDEREAVNEQKVQTQVEIKTLEVWMAQNERQLLYFKPQHEKYKKKEEEYMKMLSQLEQKRSEIYDRLGRHEQFGTKEERDAWLQDELESVSKAVEEIQIKESKMGEELQKDAEQESKLKDEIEGLKKVEVDYHSSIDTLENNLFSAEKKRVEKETMLSELFRRDSEVEQKHSSLRDDLTKAKQLLCSIADKNVIEGLEGLQEVMKKLQGHDEASVSGYYGTVLENLECSDSLLTAVEVTAGKRLFYHIVATDEVSSKITKEFNHSNLHGEINFFLLNRLSVKELHYPVSNDAFPLIQKLQYVQEFDKAMKNVFGRTVLCRNMQVAFHFVDEYHLDCITLEGDQALRSGSLCGGYRDKSRSTILVYKNYTLLQKLLNETEEEVQKIKNEIKDIRDEMTQYTTDKQKLERKIMNAKSASEHVKSRKILLSDDLDGVKEVRAKKEKLQEQYHSTLEVLQARRTALESELNHEMTSHLSESEQMEVDQLNNDIRRLTEECKKLFSERLQLQYDRVLLLKNTFTKQHETLSETLENLKEDSICRSLDLTKMILESMSKDLDDIQEQLKDTEKAIQETKEEQMSVLDKLKSQKAEETKIQKEVDDYDKEIKLFAAKKNTLMIRIEECNESIAKLGPLPLQEQTRYQNMGTKQILKMLTGVNRKLKKFHKMNIQAECQYADLLNKDKNAKLKLESLEEGYNGILELLHVLETQKNDAVLFTFRQASENFSSMFKKLVPTGRAQLTMKTSENDVVRIEDVADVSTIKGVGISVSFDANGLEVHDMKETSGGEKSLLALTLIFALQKCSPVPFCVIDEVDSMLDGAYRPALAQLISELSKETQFIVTTHGHDIINYGDQFYGVKNINQADTSVSEKHTVFISKSEEHHCLHLQV